MLFQPRSQPKSLSAKVSSSFPISTIMSASFLLVSKLEDFAHVTLKLISKAFPFQPLLT